MKNQIIASIGLISDTHYQDRLFNLPPGLADVWTNIDLILHAGDIGDLSVLDLLSKFAPVMAVHGNDEPDNVLKELPYQQIVAISGFGILLWHSHYPDPEEEKSKRKGAWGSKLERIAVRGCEVNAKIVVFGHTHVPMIYRQGDMLLINPGALSSGSYFTRQLVASVGRLQILANGELEVALFDVATGRVREFKVANPAEEFNLLADQYQEWIVEPDLIPDVGALRRLTYENVRAIVHELVPLYKRCLIEGIMLRKDLIEAIRSSNLITSNDKRNVLAVIDPKLKSDLINEKVPIL
jgi:uncharacterized protein